MGNDNLVVNIGDVRLWNGSRWVARTLDPRRMSTADKNALVAAIGSIVFDTDLGKLCVWDGAAWQTIASV